MTKKNKVRYPKALQSTPARIAEFIKDPGLREVYRQTRSAGTGQWNFPRARTSDGKWRPIKNSKYVVTTQNDGSLYTVFAIWRMWEIKQAVKDENGKQKWAANIHVVHTKRYSLYYLLCRRMRHSISGAGIG